MRRFYHSFPSSLYKNMGGNCDKTYTYPLADRIEWWYYIASSERGGISEILESGDIIMHLLGTENHKTVKGRKRGYETFVLYLAPGKVSGYQVCPMASKGCLDSCLFSAGYGKMDYVRNARIKKTKLFFEDRDKFMSFLVSDIKAAVRSAKRKGLTPAIRLNGTSDIRWENYGVVCSDTGKVYPNLMTMFPDVQFYDYTKLPNRKRIPENYHLTFSRSEENDNLLTKAIKNGLNVAVVFDSLPETYMGLPVYNGDSDDLRFEDPRSVIIGLKAKGDAKKDVSGFVIYT
jgi:hypothetical protein